MKKPSAPTPAPETSPHEHVMGNGAALIDPALLEPQEVADEEIEPDPLDIENLLAGDSDLLQRALTAILFLEPEPITAGRLAQSLGLPLEAVEQGLEGAIRRLAEEGIIVVSGSGTYRMGTHPEVASVLERYFKKARKRRLSRAMLETLSIVACRGPVTRAEIEEIRQVNSDGVLARCLELEYIEIVGQKESVGRPLLYGIAEEFLRYFGLQTVEELQDCLPAEWLGVPRQQVLDLDRGESATAIEPNADSLPSDSPVE